MLLSSSGYFIFLVAIFLLYWPVARVRALALGVILLATGMITHDICKNEFSYNLEKVQHPVTALYVADLIDLPISHPVQQGG